MSFVYDVADLSNFETVVPVAFRIAAQAARGRLSDDPARAVRIASRDAFRRTDLLGRIIPTIEAVLSAGEIPPPKPPPDAVGPAFPDLPPSGDVGHRG